MLNFPVFIIKILVPEKMPKFNYDILRKRKGQNTFQEISEKLIRLSFSTNKILPVEMQPSGGKIDFKMC